MAIAVPGARRRRPRCSSPPCRPGEAGPALCASIFRSLEIKKERRLGGVLDLLDPLPAQRLVHRIAVFRPLTHGDVRAMDVLLFAKCLAWDPGAPTSSGPPEVADRPTSWHRAWPRHRAFSAGRGRLIRDRNRRTAGIPNHGACRGVGLPDALPKMITPASPRIAPAARKLRPRTPASAPPKNPNRVGAPPAPAAAPHSSCPPEYRSSKARSRQAR